MEAKPLKIDTGMYGQRAFDALTRLRSRMSDGTRRCGARFWLNFDVVRAEDDQVRLEVAADPERFYCGRVLKNPFAGTDAGRFKSWLAGRLRREIEAEAGLENWPDGWWSPTSTGLESKRLGGKLDVTVADIHAVYCSLLGRVPPSDRGWKRAIGRPAPSQVVRGRKNLARAKKAALARYRAAAAKLDREFDRARAKYEDGKGALWRKYYAEAKLIDPDGELLV